MQESSPLFSEKSDSKSLTTNIEELLRQFQITKEDLDLAGIQIEDLERATSPSFLGKCLHFLVTVSISRTLMLWPFMSRGSIKLNKNTIAETQKSLSVKDRKDTSSVVLDSDDWHLSSNTEDEGTEEEISDLSLTSDINNEDDEPQKMEKIIEEKKESWSAPVLTSSSLLFESENVLKSVSAVSAFHDTTDTLLNGVWNAFLSSLIINGLVNYILYPEEREPKDLLDAFGITGLRNIACIRSIESIKNSTLCSENYKEGFNDILSSSLNSYYIWPFIAGIPIVFGIMNAVHASWNMKALNKQEIKQFIRDLEDYNPKRAYVDSLGWIFAAAIPDLFPPAAILSMLPQPTIKQTLEKIKQTIIWDGRLSAKDRKKLFDKLIEFAEQRSQFTQMKALSMLSDIVDGIDFKNLTLLKEEGVDDETIKTLVIIKAKAFKKLDYFANNYNLPDEPPSLLKPFFRYLCSNYLMWKLGYNKAFHLQPLFFASNAIKLYYTLIFFKSIIGGIIEIINNYLDKKNCLEAGNEWSYFEVLDEFKCTVCEDFNLFYHDIFTAKDCVRAYFNGSKKRSFSDIMNNIVHRDKQKNSWNIYRALNLNEVTSLILTNYNIDFQPGELAVLLNSLKFNLTILQRFELERHGPLNLMDSNAFGHFIQYLPIEELKLIFTSLNDELMISIANALPKTKIRNLALNVIPLEPKYNISTIEVLAAGLQNSTVNHLELLLINNHEMEIISSILPGSKITWLKLQHGITNAGCQALAEKIPLSRIQFLQLEGVMEHGVCSCAENLTNALIHVKQDFNLVFLVIGGNDNYVDLFTKALSKTPTLPLKTLKFGRYLSTTQASIITLLRVLPNSQLVDFQMPSPYSDEYFNYSVIIPQLADAINQSTITYFDFSPNKPLSPNELDILISFLPNKLRKITGLSLYGEFEAEYGSERVKTFFKALRDTNIKKLYLSDIDIKNTLTVLAEILPHTNITELLLQKCNIENNDIRILAKVLNQCKIEVLELDYNNIDDKSVHPLFEGLRGSSVKRLNLGSNNITDKGAKAIAQALTTDKIKHGLWIERVNAAKQMSLIRALAYNPRTNLTSANVLSLNYIGNDGARALCDVLPQTEILPGSLNFYESNMHINKNIIDNCGTLLNSTYSSSAISLRPMGPYVLLYRLYHVSQQSLQSFYAILYKRYKASMVNSIQPEQEYNDTDPELIPSDIFSEQAVSIIDASDYLGGETIVVDLNDHDVVAARGSINRNNLFIGGEESLLDVHQSRRTNFLQSGKNNKLRLGFFSKDHVVVTENQGTIQIEGFDSKDTLHLISEHTVYNIETNMTICQNEIIKNDIPAAVIHLQGTTVQLVNARCEDMENNIEINNNEAIYAARAEVMDVTENHQSILNSNLLSICETFLNSVSKSAMFTAVPVFAAEILYQSGGYTRGEAEKFGQEIQTILVLSFADSPHAIAASTLASLLASRLTNSPNIISIVGIGASIVTSLAVTVLSDDVALGWMALQTGVALMGSVFGSHGVRWGMTKASDVKDYLSSRMGFWLSNSEEKIAQKNVMFHTQSILSGVDQDSRTHFTI